MRERSGEWRLHDAADQCHHPSDHPLLRFRSRPQWWTGRDGYEERGDDESRTRTAQATRSEKRSGASSRCEKKGDESEGDSDSGFATSNKCIATRNKCINKGRRKLENFVTSSF